jgi:hypothetical protein
MLNPFGVLLAGQGEGAGILRDTRASGAHYFMEHTYKSGRREEAPTSQSTLALQVLPHLMVGTLFPQLP